MIHVYVPAELHRRLEQFQADRGWSNAELVLGAIERTHDALVIPTYAEREGNGLFSRSYRPRVAPSTNIVPVGVRLLQSDIDQIDELVSASTTSSRSAYIVAALQALLAVPIHQEETRDQRPRDPSPRP